MPTKQKYKDALRKAAAAGDTEAANEFAAILDHMEAEGIDNYYPGDPPGLMTPAARQKKEAAAAAAPKATKPAPTPPDPLQPRKTASERAQANKDRRVQASRNRPMSNFSKGVKRIAEGDVSLGEVAELGETAVRSLTGPLGGDQVAAGAENIVRVATGQPINPEALNQQRARREELAGKAPLLAGASEAGGYANLANLMRKLPGMNNFLKPARSGGTVGQRVGNAGKVATEAAAVTAIGETLKGDDPVTVAKESATAALVAPPAAAVLRTVTDRVSEVPRVLKDTFTASTKKTPKVAAQVRSMPSESAMKAIAERTNTPVEEIQGLFDEFMRVNGRPPRFAELLDPQTLAQYRTALQRRPNAAEVLNEAEDIAALQRPENVRAAVEQGQPSLSRERATQIRDDQLTAALRAPRGQGGTALADDQLTFDNFSDILTDTDVISAIPGRSPLRRILAEAEETGTITLGDLENIRLAFSGRAGAGDAYRFTEAARALAARMEQASDGYRNAMDRYRRQSQFIDGAERGEKVLTGSADDFEQVIPTLTADAQAGVREGARSAIGRRGGESAASAITTSRALTQPGTERRVAAAIDPAEAERLAAVGETQMRGARNMATLSPRQELPPALADSVQDLAEVVLASTVGASTFMLARISGMTAGRLRALGIPPNAAVKMAQLITDPAETQTVINALRAAGVADQELQGIIQQITAAIVAAEAGDAELTPSAVGSVTGE